MNVFVDTSAILAVLNADDHYHSVAKSSWENLLVEGIQLYFNNYMNFTAAKSERNHAG